MTSRRFSPAVLVYSPKIIIKVFVKMRAHHQRAVLYQRLLHSISSMVDPSPLRDFHRSVLPAGKAFKREIERAVGVGKASFVRHAIFHEIVRRIYDIHISLFHGPSCIEIKVSLRQIGIINFSNLILHFCFQGCDKPICLARRGRRLIFYRRCVIRAINIAPCKRGGQVIGRSIAPFLDNCWRNAN